MLADLKLLVQNRRLTTQSEGVEMDATLWFQILKHSVLQNAFLSAVFGLKSNYIHIYVYYIICFMNDLFVTSVDCSSAHVLCNYVQPFSTCSCLSSCFDICFMYLHVY